jgi:hemolysin activation/secretion protein
MLRQFFLGFLIGFLWTVDCQPVKAQIKTINSVEQVQVKRFKYIGNTAFSEAELDKLTQAWTNRPLTFQDLLNVREVITDRYANAGYTTAFAQLPIEENQNLDADQATIVIQIIEGQITSVSTDNARHGGWIQGRLLSQNRQALNHREMLKQLQILRLNPTIQAVQAELLPGERIGGHHLKLKITEAPQFDLEVGGSNHRSSDSGRWEGSLNLNWQNPLDLGDRLQVGLARTEGSLNWDMAYQSALGRSGKTNLSLDYRSLSSQIIKSPFRKIDIKTRSTVWEAGLEQNIQQTLSPRSLITTDVGVTLGRINSESTILDRPFPLSVDSDETGRQGLSVLRLYQKHQQRSDRAVFAGRSQFSFGLPWNSTVGVNGVDGRFFSWRGQVLLNQPTNWGRLLLRATLQLSPGELPTYEKLSLGGVNTVRGYRNDAALGNSGLNTSAELSIPMKGTGFLWVPFINAGSAWNQGAPRQSLASVGLGLQWTHRNLSARINYAIPVFTSLDRSSWQGNQFDFSTTYRYAF